MKKFPLLSILLVIATYGTFAWTIANKDNFSIFDIILGVVFASVISLLITLPMTSLNRIMSRSFRSGFGPVLFIFSFTLISIILMAWLRVFAGAIMLIAATLLARVDLRTGGFPKWQAFWILLLSSLLGLSLGWSGFYLVEIKKIISI